jgi:hypothetical protein
MENLPEEIIYNIAGFLEHGYDEDSKDLISLHFVNKILFNMYRYSIRKILKLLSAKYVKTSIMHAYDGQGNSGGMSRYFEEKYYYAKSLHEILEKLNIKIPEIKDKFIFCMVDNDQIYHKYYNIFNDIGSKFYVSDYFGDDEDMNEQYYPSGGYMRHYFYHIISINDKKYVISMDKLCPKSPYKCIIKDNGKLPKSKFIICI